MSDRRVPHPDCAVCMNPQESESVDEQLKANALELQKLLKERMNEGVEIEITVEDRTILLPPEIGNGRYTARLTRIQGET